MCVRRADETALGRGAHGAETGARGGTKVEAAAGEDYKGGGEGRGCLAVQGAAGGEQGGRHPPLTPFVTV